jgi:hypothetical protein
LCDFIEVRQDARGGILSNTNCRQQDFFLARQRELEGARPFSITLDDIPARLEKVKRFHKVFTLTFHVPRPSSGIVNPLLSFRLGTFAISRRVEGVKNLVQAALTSVKPSVTR